MFTGIVTNIGRILNIEKNGDLTVTVACEFNLSELDIGASVAHDGICLTVTEKSNSADQNWYKVSLSEETISKTFLSDSKTFWKIGSLINLERSLKVGDELGGHIVTGHVDGVAKVLSIERIGSSTKISLECPFELASFIARKGSVTLNGTSLTINDVRETIFDVNLIPHTKEVTNWKTVAVQDKVNIEIDILARYVSRLKEMKA